MSNPNPTSSPAEARIEQLEQIEKDVIDILKSAGTCVLEIGKDRPSQKAVDTNVTQVCYSHCFTVINVSNLCRHYCVQFFALNTFRHGFILCKVIFQGPC